MTLRPRRRRSLGFAVLAFAGLVASSASWAIGLGEIHLRSMLGEPLRAEIELIGGADGALDGACFRIAPGSDSETGYPWLRQARIALEHGAGGARLLVSTAKPVWDPVIEVGIDVSCGVSLTRRYTLLPPLPQSAPDLPEVPAMPAPVAQASAPAMTEALPGTAPEEATSPTGKSPGKRRLAKAPAAAPASTGEAAPPRQAGAKRRPPKEDRLSLSGSEPGEPLPLAMSARIADPGRTGHMSDRQRELLRQEQQLFIRLMEQADEQQALDQQLKVLDERIAVARAKIEEGERKAREAEAAAVRPISASRPAPVPAARQESDDTWWLLAGLVVVALAVIFWLRRRSATPEVETLVEEGLIETPAETPSQAPTEIEAETEVPHPPSPTPAAPPAWSLEPAAAEPVPRVVEWSSGGVESQPRQKTVAPKAAVPSIDVLAEPSNDEEAVLELADVLLAMGMSGQARDTLASYITVNPRQAITPWLKLLRVHYAAGQRAEFEKLAGELNRTFNIDVIPWDRFDQTSSGATLEQYGHLRTNLTALWGRPECLGFLQDLLVDNREGERRGFPIEVVEEILTLIAVLRRRDTVTP